MTTSKQELPEGWLKSPLMDLIVDMQSGFACGVHNKDGNGIPHLRPMNINVEGEIDLSELKFVARNNVDREERLLNKGDVLFNNTNSPKLVGKTAYYGFDEQWAFSNHMTRVKCNTNVLLSRYCSFFLHQRWREGYFKKICKNYVCQAGISTRKLFATQVTLPAVSEQKRIVNVIEKLFVRVNNTKEQLNNASETMKRFRKSVLNAACTGKLTEDWREKHPEIESWDSNLLGGIVKTIDGDRGPNYPKRADYLKEGHSLFLSTKNVRPDGFSFDEEVYISKGKHEQLRNGTLQRGDIVITTRGTLGNVAYYDSNVPYDVVRINSGMLILRIQDKKISPKYLSFFIQSPLFKKQTREKQSGSAQPQLPAGVLKTFDIKNPSSKEQQVIVRKVERLFKLADKIECRIAEARGRVGKLTQSILAKAFRGELVPTEAKIARIAGREYETAEQLLERIKVEQERNKVAKMKKKKMTKNKTKARVKKKSFEDIFMPNENLLEIISKSKDGIKPEDLLDASYYTVDTIEKFYEELASLENAGKIEDYRPHNRLSLLREIKK